MFRKQYMPAMMLVIIGIIFFQFVLEASTPKFHVDVGLNHFYKNRYLEAY